MSEIIKGGPFSNVYFSAVKHQFFDDKGISHKTQFLVLRDRDTGLIVKFTELEYLNAPFTEAKPVYHKTDPKHHLYCIANALNFIFLEQWWNFHIEKLSDVTRDMIFKAFDTYVETPVNGKYRSQQSIDLYVKNVSAFFANASLFSPNFKVKPGDLFYKKKTESKNTLKKIEGIWTPIYHRKSLKNSEGVLMRKIPTEAIDILISQAKEHDPQLVFMIIVGITAGLRVSEICNLRQCESPVSSIAGIQFSYEGNAVTKILIDLTEEFCLRSDKVFVGGIKKHRTVQIYKPFIREFLEGYTYHMELLKSITYEKKFSPMFVDRRGKAMTSETMTDRFNTLVTKYFISALYASGNPKLITYAQELESKHLTPHILRHYFTVRLVLLGLDPPSIAKLRGDKSEDSSRTDAYNKAVL